MKVVLDTNVLLAGIATHGICEGLVTISFRDHTVVLSEYILHELAEHYVGKFRATPRDAAIVADTLRKQGEIVVPAAMPDDACCDADDLPILGTAVAGRVDYLITGDQDLLALGAYEGIPILSPREFHGRLRASG